MAGDNSLGLRNLVGEDFSGYCRCPKSGKKRWYCINHSSGHCSGCIERHQHHLLVQIRSYMKQAAVTFDSLATMIDCGTIQSYKYSSGIQVVLLHKMDRKKAQPDRFDVCVSCQCLLLAPLGSYCSLSCWVEGQEKMAAELERESGSAAAASSSAG